MEGRGEGRGRGGGDGRHIRVIAYLSCLPNPTVFLKFSFSPLHSLALPSARRPTAQALYLCLRPLSPDFLEIFSGHPALVERHEMWRAARVRMTSVALARVSPFAL